MKVIAINGSARKDGNTSILINAVFKELKACGIETEMVQLAGKKLRGCTACYQCFQRKDRRCAIANDYANDVIDRMFSADGIILASPTYFSDVSAEMKALIDRAGFVSRANGDLLRRKVGAGIVAVRRSGAISTFDTLNHFFLAAQMIVPGSCHWNIGVGKDIGDVESDAEGMDTMSVLGKNMAWLMGKICK